MSVVKIVKKKTSPKKKRLYISIKGRNLYHTDILLGMEWQLSALGYILSEVYVNTESF